MLETASACHLSVLTCNRRSNRPGDFFVNQTTKESAGHRSLTETLIEGFQLFNSAEVSSGRGCVLQIFPATAQAEMFRLSNRRTLIGREPTCDISLDDNAVSRTSRCD